MSFIMRLDKHAGLVSRMADTLDVDLTEKAMRGEMAGTDMRGLVMNCMTCSAPGECEHFLETHKSGADEAPHYCRNYDFFAEMKR